MKGVSLFSSAGIAEQYLKDLGIDIVVANELLSERARLYQCQYPDTRMVCGDITKEEVYAEVVRLSPEHVDFLLASPPCQGMSVAGKNRNQAQMLTDQRNFLVFRIFDFIQAKQPDFVLIENVSNFLKIRLPYNGSYAKVTDILHDKFGAVYNVEHGVYDASDYGVPQRRARAIIRMYMRTLSWGEPEKQPKITVEEAIGGLPSIEAGESSSLKWHFARRHNKRQVECMMHTATGKSAMDNEIFYPRKENGERVKAYNTTYRRIRWDEPAPTITMRNDAISSQLNVHPGRLRPDGTYSDARVLTPLELMLLSSLPANWSIPDDTPEILIRKCIGECIPPMLIKRIVEQINR